MADYRAARDADLFVVSARTDLRWTEWLVLCFSTDGCGVDAFFAFARAEVTQLKGGATSARLSVICYQLLNCRAGASPAGPGNDKRERLPYKIALSGPING